MTAAELKEYLSTPFAILALMIFAALGSAWKQLIVARRSGDPGFNMGTYFTQNWPETLTTIGLSVVAWFTMVLSNTLDPLIALGGGYIANDVSDLVTGKGRSSGMGFNLPAGDDKKQGGFVNVSMLLTITLIGSLALLAACSVNPFKTAQTGEQKADALYGQYVIAKEHGASILNDSSLPDSAKRPIAEAMVASKPIADSFHDALTEYSTVKAQLAAGTTSDERLLIARENMDRWLVRATPLINQLIVAVGGIWK